MSHNNGFRLYCLICSIFKIIDCLVSFPGCQGLRFGLVPGQTNRSKALISCTFNGSVWQRPNSTLNYIYIITRNLFYLHLITWVVAENKLHYVVLFQWIASFKWTIRLGAFDECRSLEIKEPQNVLFIYFFSIYDPVKCFRRLHANPVLAHLTSNMQTTKSRPRKNVKGKSEATENNMGTQRTRREQMQDAGDTWWKTGKQTKTGSKTRHFQHKTGDQLN